jgi:hypothetical protein
MSTTEGAKQVIRDGLIAYWDMANPLSNPTASSGGAVSSLPNSSSTGWGYIFYDMIGNQEMYLPSPGTTSHQYQPSTTYGPAYYKPALGNAYGPLTKPLTGSLNNELSGFTLEVIGGFYGSAQTSGFIGKGTNTAIANVFYPTSSAAAGNLDWMLQPAQGSTGLWNPQLTQLWSTTAFQCRVTSSAGITVLTAFAFDSASNGTSLRSRNIHYTATFDGGRIKLYINGKEDQSQAPFSFWPEPQTNPIYSSTQYIKQIPGGITNGRLLNSSNIIETFKKYIYTGYGYLHTLRIYNRALSDAEVLQNYNFQRGRQGYSSIQP